MLQGGGEINSTYLERLFIRSSMHNLCMKPEMLEAPLKVHNHTTHQDWYVQKAGTSECLKLGYYFVN